jgi:hypothetical protein
MLNPDERAHLLELLRPPIGYELGCAVGTTFSLDLVSALMLPLSFAFFDWEKPDGELVADPLALLEALRRYGDRFTIFCQSGQIHLPAKYPPLVTFLEPCICDVQAPDPEGIFHPKVWALKFVAKEEAVRYRILCLSRNLTFDRCWDTAVALDGELLDRTNGIAANHPLGDFIATLPKLASRSLGVQRRRDIANMADELRRVRFAWPEGFDESQCRFWVAGLDGRTATPFGERRDKTLIVSPFLTDSVVRDFQNHGETHLVSRQECLQELPVETVKKCKSTYFLAPEADEHSDEDAEAVGQQELLDGLHAKLFIIDRGWDASVFTGSFNATVHALQHNVEFMVELVGKRSKFGVDEFLRQVKGETRFPDLLQRYDVTAEAKPVDAVAHQLDELLFAAKRALIKAGPRLIVKSREEAELFDLYLEFASPLRLPAPSVSMRAWPITAHSQWGQQLDGKPISFSRLSYMGLTPLIAFEVSVQIWDEPGQTVFVLNLPLEGAPEDRQDRVVRSLIENRDQLLRYILFLLAAGDEASTSSSDLRRILDYTQNSGAREFAHPYLLESMLRALHRSPVQLGRVASLLDVLRKSPSGSELLSDDFQAIWEPIWDAAQQVMAK